MKDVIKDAVGQVTSGLIKENAIIAFLLFIVALLLAWYLYTNHMLQQQIVAMRIADYEMEVERYQRLDEFSKKLNQIRGDVTEIRNTEVKFSSMLRELRDRPCINATGDR